MVRERALCHIPPVPPVRFLLQILFSASQENLPDITTETRECEDGVAPLSADLAFVVDALMTRLRANNNDRS